jgi:hypothetical protein
MPWRRMGEWRYSSTILDLGTRWRWVASYMSRPLYYRGKNPGIHRIGSWVEPRARDIRYIVAARTTQKTNHVIAVAVWRYRACEEVCLPSRCLEAGCIISLFHCYARIAGCLSVRYLATLRPHFRFSGGFKTYKSIEISRSMFSPLHYILIYAMYSMWDSKIVFYVWDSSFLLRNFWLNSNVFSRVAWI